MNKEKVIIRPHFLYIFNLLYPYLTLLIIPVIRTVAQYIFLKSQTFSQFLVLELAVLILAVSVSVVKFKRYKIEFCGDITVKKGLFCKTEYTLKERASKITVIESNPVLRLLGVFRFKIFTEAGGRKRPQESVLIGVSDAEKIYRLNFVNGQSVRSNTYGEVIMSAALSSSTTGILISIPIVKLAFSLLGKSLPSLLPAISSDSLKNVDFIKLGQYITAVLIAGYIISFLVLFFRNYGFSSVRENGKIMLVSGKLPRRTVFLNPNSVKAVRFITAPIMLCAGKCAVKFSACGYGLGKGEIGLLMPSVKPSIAKGLIKWLLPKFEVDCCGIKPPKKAIKRCLKLPLAVMGVLFVSKILIEQMYPQTEKIVLLIFSGVGFAVLIWTLMRIYAFFRSQISLSDDYVSLKNLKGLRFSELHGLNSQIYCIKVSTTPFDRFCGQCSVNVRFFGKNKDMAKVKYIEMEQFKSHFEKCYRHL